MEQESNQDWFCIMNCKESKKTKTFERDSGEGSKGISYTDKVTVDCLRAVSYTHLKVLVNEDINISTINKGRVNCLI